MKSAVTNFDNGFEIYVKTLTAETLILRVNSEMNIATVKKLIQDQKDIYPDQQRLVFGGQKLEDEKTLEEYDIHIGSTVHLIERLRGGMYHFTSGRQDFNNLPYNGANAVKNVLAFDFKDKTHALHLPSVELQEFVLQAHTVLSALKSEINEIHTPYNLPNLKAVISSITTEDEETNDDDDLFLF